MSSKYSPVRRTWSNSEKSSQKQERRSSPRVADETYPTNKEVKKKHREENQKRKKEGKKPLPYPKGFTLATAYLSTLSIFASLVVQDLDFFFIALLLMQPLKGTDYIVDGEPSYNGICDNMKRCTIHRRRRIADKDPPTPRA